MGTLLCLKKYWFRLLMGIIILFNALLLVRAIFKNNNPIPSGPPTQPHVDIDFYNSPCPEISLKSLSGETFDTRALSGNVIIFQFSRFYKRDLPFLAYLEHLKDYYSNSSIRLFLINILGKHSKEISNFYSFSSPIILDDGNIFGLFNAHIDDTIIIDRSFNIRFKSIIRDKQLIYDEVRKWLDESALKDEAASLNNLTSSLANLSYFDVISKSNKLISFNSGKRVVITLYTSLCMDCEEASRARLVLKEAARNKGAEYLILFGKGNNAAAIREYALSNRWDVRSVTIGIILSRDSQTNVEYNNLFSLEVDPRTFIIDEHGKTVMRGRQKELQEN